MNETDNDSRARVRYRKRGIFSTPDNEKKLFLNDLSHRLIPSLSFYIFAIISGISCGIAFMFDSKALIVLTLALIPFMGPFFGMALSCTSGSLSFLLKSFLKYLLALGLFILSAFGVGGMGSLQNHLSPETIQYFSTVQLMPVITVALCAFLAAIFITGNSPQIPQALSNGAMFGVMIPVGLAGYCLSLQIIDPILPCIKSSLVYSLIGITASALAFIIRRAFALKASSFLMILIIFSGCTVYFLDYFKVIQVDFSQKFELAKENVISLVTNPTETPTLTTTFTATTTNTPTMTLTNSPTVTSTHTKTSTPTATFTETSTPTSTNTPVPPTNTPTFTMTPTKTTTPTRTLRPSKTPTITFTPSPTIIYGIVYVPNDVGLLIRERPDYAANVMKSQYNNSLLEIIGETAQTSDGMFWTKVRTNDGLEGWVAQSTLRTATPMP